MKYAISTYTYYYEHDWPMTEIVRMFADDGFDSMSFTPADVLSLDCRERGDVRAILDDRGLTATIHGKCDLTSDQLESILSMFGGRLCSVTLDSARVEDSRGSLFDGPKIGATLAMIEEMTNGTDIRFGVEDFPLDRLCAGFYREHIGRFLGSPRFGMLVDVGHMNLRLRDAGYFKGLTPGEYFARIPVPILEVHLHDNSGDDDRHGHFGFGNVDFAAVALGLRSAGFDGMATVEICPLFHGSKPPASKPRAKESLDTWRKLWIQAGLALEVGNRDAAGRLPARGNERE